MKSVKILFVALSVGVCANAQSTLTLDECVTLAVKNNRSVKNNLLEIEAGKEQQKEMKTKYLPEISANVLAFHAFDKIVKGDGTYPKEIAALEAVVPGIAQMAGQSFSFAELNRGFSVNVSAMLPVYTGGQNTTANELARVGSEVAELKQELTEKDIVEKVTENYWKVVQLKYNMLTLDAAQKQLDAVEKRVTDLVENGVTTRNALLQVRLRKQELESNRVKVEHGDRLLRLLLAQQIGVDDVDVVVPKEETIPVLPQFSQNNGFERTELKLAAKAVEAQRLQVKMERGKCMPTVAVGVMGFHSTLGGFSDMVSSYVNTSMTNGIGLATVSVPISAWFGGKHAIRRANIKLQQLQNDYQEAKEQLGIDTESARLNVIEAHRQIDIARASVEESEENMRMVTDQYEVGTVQITDLLDAETLNRKAHNDLSSALAEYHVAVAKYERKAAPVFK